MGSNDALEGLAIMESGSVKSLQEFELYNLRTRARVLRECLQGDKRFLYTAASGCLVKPLILLLWNMRFRISTTKNRLY